ncbi:class C sortase [Streptococcus halichoeri]|uniref:class C sortase n=1 Tax=Streptococcus halichoeri TaxID=254785 RepID=UPI00135ADF30|nr:class C sortase [Streptococcus halichoeri]
MSVVKYFSKKVRLRLWLSRLLFGIGLAVLAFPFVSQWLYYRASHAAINTFKEAVTTLDRTEIKRRLELAHAYNVSLAGAESNGKVAVSDPYSAAQKKAGQAEYARMLEVREQIGHVIIPRINQDLPIYAGSSEANLQRGVGHLEGTSLPVGGQSTHAVLTAHRGLPTAKLFTNLDKMKRGDRFYIEHIGGKIAYQVDKIEVISPNQLEALHIVPNKDYVTLLTCTPYMINSHRLLVRGIRISYHEQAEHHDRALASEHHYQLYLLIGVGVAIFVCLLLWYHQKESKK